ncbi:hypothetical protein ACHAPT_005392 [Fusarium lateritium]
MGESTRARLSLETKTVIGTSISLVGFVLQFIGLRGLYWSASIAQLLSIMIMTVLRAAIRRGLAKALQTQRPVPGYELDWLAMRLSDLDDAPFFEPPKGDIAGPRSSGMGPYVPGGPKEHETGKKQTQHPIEGWVVATGFEEKNYTSLIRAESGIIELPRETQAHKTMQLRRGLAKQADWRGPASTEAISLTLAIEAFMDVLCPPLRAAFLDPPLPEGSSDFIWCIYIEKERQAVELKIEQRERRWKLAADEVEAALSLWLYSVSSQVKNRHEAQDEKPKAREGRDDQWLRDKGPRPEVGLRLLGPDTARLRRDYH